MSQDHVPKYTGMPSSYERDKGRRKFYGEAKRQRMRDNFVEGELWIPIPGYRIYEVSNLGRVKNAKTEKVLKPHVNSYGYATVGLVSDRGVRATKSVHRLVAYLFCDGYDEELHVNHIDGVKLNNRAYNLEWVTPKQNVNHAIETGLWDPSAERPTMAKGVRLIETGQEFRTQKDCGDFLGVPGSAIRYALKHGTRTAGYHVEYL